MNTEQELAFKSKLHHSLEAVNVITTDTHVSAIQKKDTTKKKEEQDFKITRKWNTIGQQQPQSLMYRQKLSITTYKSNVGLVNKYKLHVYKTYVYEESGVVLMMSEF